MTGEYERHYLLLGATRNAYDRCHKVLLCDRQEAPYPMQALVRPYFNVLSQLQGPPMRPRALRDRHLFDCGPPTYFAGQAHGELAVVDLTAAYWQIYAPLTLDLDYDGLELPRQGRIRFLGAEELGTHKHLRNSLIGAIRAEHRTEVVYGKARKIPVTPRWQRPGLWAVVQDILELVAWDMRLCFGAVHIHTDGYILPSVDLAHDAVDFLRDEWGLDASVRASGDGVVIALGSWRIETDQAGEPRAEVGVPVDSMSHTQAQPELRRWYQEAKAYRDQVKEVSLRNGLTVPW
jgi:hypothetical protein